MACHMGGLQSFCTDHSRILTPRTGSSAMAWRYTISVAYHTPGPYRSPAQHALLRHHAPRVFQARKCMGIVPLLGSRRYRGHLHSMATFARHSQEASTVSLENGPGSLPAWLQSSAAQQGGYLEAGQESPQSEHFGPPP